MFGVLHPVHDLGHVAQKDGGVVAVGYNDVVVIAAGDQLIVGVDLIILTRPIKVAFGLIDAGSNQGASYRFQIDAVRLELCRIHLNPHRRLLAAANAYQTNAVELRDLGRQTSVDQVLDLREGKRFGSNCQSENGRVGRVGFAVDWRCRQIRGQEALRGVDRRLHLFLGHVDAQRKSELQHHDRGGAGAGRGHLAQALHLAELPFQRSGHG